MENKKKLNLVDILKKFAVILIAFIFLLMFIDTIKYLLIVALVSIAIVVIQALFTKYANDTLKKKAKDIVSIFSKENIVQSKSLFGKAIKKIQESWIVSALNKLINFISETIFDLLSLLSSKLFDITKDEDNFTKKGFPSKKDLMSRCIHFTVIFSLIIIAIKFIFNILHITSFAVIFTLKTLCILLPILALVFFMGAIFYSFNKEKHDFISDVRKYLIDSDENTVSKKCAKSIADDFIKLFKDSEITISALNDNMLSAQEKINKINNPETNKKLESEIIAKLKTKFSIQKDEQIDVNKFKKFNNFELREIKAFIEKCNKGNRGEFLTKVSDQIDVILAREANEISEKISEAYYIVLEKTHEVKNWVKELGER